MKKQNKDYIGGLIMMSGLPASGKSTLAKKILEVLPNSIRVNKDSLRKMLNFGEFSRHNEKEVRFTEEFLVRKYLSEGKIVVVDDTNLTEYHEKMWNKIASEVGLPFIKLTVNTPWEECVKRDQEREDSVGELVIKNFALEQGKVEGKFVLCDLDGTLCDIEDRLHFVTCNEHNDEKNWKAFFANIPGDKLRMDVASTVASLRDKGYTIIYVSARPEEYRGQTLVWLQEKGVNFNFSLIMRKLGDRRDDVIVKREMLNKYFKNRDQIHLVIDDRPKVLRMWKEELGAHKVLDVGSGVEF